ncbi:NAD(P)/FAD-dependent oxidoreductase [Nocardioides korecus]
MHEAYDVVVVGGGAAGLSGAIALARSRRRVLVVDGGRPRNAPAEGVHNLLGQEGLAPAELVARGRETLRSYGGQLRVGTVVSGAAVADGFVLTVDDGTQVGARRVLVASGLVDELPDLPGVAERWGHQVLHCPYCHGWEVRDQRIGVLATGPAAVHQALLFSQLSDRVTVLAHLAPPSPDDVARLGAAGVRVVAGEVEALVGPERALQGVRLVDGTLVDLDAVVVAPRMVARSPLLESLGMTAADHPSGLGEHYPADPMGRTAVPGVWVAGNVTDLGAQVMGAAAAGLMAGAGINGELMEVDVAARLGEARGRSDGGATRVERLQPRLTRGSRR